MNTTRFWKTCEYLNRDKQESERLGHTWALDPGKLVTAMELDPTSDTTAINRIHALLNGTEWDSETIEHVADYVTQTGRVILDTHEYEERCREAATAQGLDPISSALTGAGIAHEIEQTGGMTMVIFVSDLTPGAGQGTGTFTRLGITADTDEGVLICGYNDAEPEHNDTIASVTLAELVRTVREWMP